MVIRLDHAEYDEGIQTNEIYDKTWKEVNDALEKGQIVTVKFDAPDNAVAIAFRAASTTRPTSVWFVDVHRFGDYSEPIMTLYACSEDGYLQSAQCNSGDGADDGGK